MYTLRKGFYMNKEELVQEVAKKAKLTQKNGNREREKSSSRTNS